MTGGGGTPEKNWNEGRTENVHTHTSSTQFQVTVLVSHVSYDIPLDTVP